MKKILILALALVALCTHSYAQSSPFEWQAGENTTIKLGGFVRMATSVDMGSGVNLGNDFISSNIPTNVDWSDKGYLSFDASATRLSLQITQKTQAVGDIKLYVEGDFRGTGNTVRLRQAYIDIKGFVAGQTWSFATDLAACAPTVDINGVGSRTFLRTPLVGYRHSFSESLSLGVALEMPTLSTLYPTGYESVNQYFPNIPLYVQAKTDMGHIKAGVLMRALQYGVSDSEQRETTVGWGAQVSGSLKVTKSLSLFGQAIYGCGINNYISNLASESVGLLLENDTLIATPMSGFSMGASVKFTKSFSMATSGSLVMNHGDEEYFSGAFKSTSYVALSVFYVPVNRVTVGAEYLNGTRTNYGDSSSSMAHRFSLMLKYTL